MNQLTKLTAVLGLDASGFKRELGGAENDLDSFGGRASKGASTIGLAAAGMGAAAVVGIGASIAAAAGFEKQIDSVGAVAQATATEMDKLSDAALRIGKDTAYSASEAAGAMEILAANGLTVDQILSGAADATVALAAAGGTNLAVAADVASTAMKVWNLSGEDMIDVVNRVAGAANVSRFGVEDMSQAIAMGGGVASAFGVDFKDFSTAIAASADLFASGSDAGTSFKTMLQKMVSPAGAGAEAIADLGLVFHNANGELKSLPEIAGELNRVFAGMTDQRRDNLMSDIFGTDGIRAAIGLMREGQDGFQEMSDTMGGTDAAAIAAQRMGNFNGALENLKGTIETVMIQLGTTFLPILTSLTLWLSENLPGAIAATVAAIKPWYETAKALAETLQTSLAPAISMVWGAIGPLLDKLTKNEDALTVAGILIGTILVAAFISLAVAAGIAAVNVIIAIAPFLAIALAVGLVIAAVVLLVKHWDDLTAKFPILGEMAEFVSDAFGAMAGFVKEHWEAIEGVIKAVLKVIVDVLTAQWNFVVGIVEGAMKILTGIIHLAMGLLTGDWDKAWQGVKEIVEGVWKIISTVVEFVMRMIHIFIEDGLGLIKALWALTWDIIGDKVTEIVDAVIGAVKGMIEWVADSASAMKNAVEDMMWAAVDYVRGLGFEFFNAGMNIIRDLGDGIGAMGGWLRDKVTGAVQGAKDALNPKNWIGSPKGVENWLPYYFERGLDNMVAVARQSSAPAAAASIVSAGLHGPGTGGLGGLDGAVPLGVRQAALVGQGGPGGDIAVNQNGPVYIYANDPDGGQAAKRDWSYSAAAQLRARGVA